MALMRTTLPTVAEFNAAAQPAAKASTSSPSLAGSDFIRLTAPKRQAVITLIGETGHGKGHFAAFYAPEPVYFINLDGRAQEVVEKAVSAGRDIHFVEIDNPASLLGLSEDKCLEVSKAAVAKIFRNMEAAKRASLADPNRPGTIVLDTGKELSDLVILSIRGKYTKVKDHGDSKATINRTMMRFFALARESRCHFIMLARPAAVWRNDAPVAGEVKPEGHDFQSQGADWVGELRMRTRRPSDDNPLPFEHDIKIIKAGVNLEMIGKVFKSNEWDLFGPFAHLNVSMYKGSSFEDWL